MLREPSVSPTLSTAWYGDCPPPPSRGPLQFCFVSADYPTAGQKLQRPPPPPPAITSRDEILPSQYDSAKTLTPLTPRPKPLSPTAGSVFRVIPRIKFALDPADCLVQTRLWLLEPAMLRYELDDYVQDHVADDAVNANFVVSWRARTDVEDRVESLSVDLVNKTLKRGIEAFSSALTGRPEQGGIASAMRSETFPLTSAHFSMAWTGQTASITGYPWFGNTRPSKPRTHASSSRTRIFFMGFPM
jgi:hypothetical protein